VTVASVVVPSLNFIDPVAFAGLTFAVNVTEVPEIEGLAEEETVVVVVIF
jgi:hypothetical protein